jgi:hypothetical protein
MPISGHPYDDRQELGGLPRCSARLGRGACLDIDCLGGLYSLSGLFDREMQHALVEMGADSSVLRLPVPEVGCFRLRSLRLVLPNSGSPVFGAER